MKIRLLIPVLLTLTSCHRPTDYLYIVPDPNAPANSFTHKVKDFGTGKHGYNPPSDEMDIFWLIGGMTEQAANFQAGVTTFMNQFITTNSTWRMAVAGNMTGTQPFLGMPTVFDAKSANPATTLVNAVMQSLNSIDGEMLFDPTHDQLAAYPQFLRPEATLVIIMTNDADDMSPNIRTAQQMLTFLSQLKGDPAQVVVYGVFGAYDLNCPAGSIDGATYRGSQLEALINVTGGKVYSLCDANFGTQLAKIGDDLKQLGQRFANHVYYEKLYLDPAPTDVSSIAVYFHGTPLSRGVSGVWDYDSKLNAIVFTDLSFATSDIESVAVSYN